MRKRPQQVSGRAGAAFFPDGGRLAIAVFVLRQHQQAGWPPQSLGHRGRRSKNDPEGVAFEYEVLECTTYVVPELTRNAYQA